MNINTLLVILTPLFFLPNCAYRYGAQTFFVGENLDTQIISEQSTPTTPEIKDKISESQCHDVHENTLEMTSNLNYEKQIIITTAKSSYEITNQCSNL